jgi:excisionase family DNA binding protein
MRGGTVEPVSPEELAVPILEKDQREILEIYQKVRQSRAKLVGPDGKSQNLPDSVYAFLCQLLADLHTGKTVTIFQNDSQLSTIEASRFLGVSRAHLISLLDRKEIPHFMVGSHRRMYLRDVLQYKVRRDANRRKLISDLALGEEADGLYEDVGSDSAV